MGDFAELEFNNLEITQFQFYKPLSELFFFPKIFTVLVFFLTEYLSSIYLDVSTHDLSYMPGIENGESSVEHFGLSTICSNNKKIP